FGLVADDTCSYYWPRHRLLSSSPLLRRSAGMTREGPLKQLCKDKPSFVYVDRVGYEVPIRGRIATEIIGRKTHRDLSPAHGLAPVTFRDPVELLRSEIIIIFNMRLQGQVEHIGAL